MRQAVVRRLILLLVLAGTLLPRSVSAQNTGKKEKEKKGATKLQFHVTGAPSKKPLQGAEVWVRSEEKDEDFQDTVTTNASGAARLPGVPHGQVVVQVTLKGWIARTEHYKLTQEELDIGIELEPEPEEDSRD